MPRSKPVQGDLSAHFKPSKSSTTQVRMDEETLALLDAIVDKNPSSRGRSEVIRALIHDFAAKNNITAK